MGLRAEWVRSGEVVAASPGDIEVIVYGESFPAKKLKKDVISRPVNDMSDVPHAGCDGCIEVGDWLTKDRHQEFRDLMSFPKESPATVFQIVVNVPPVCRLICEWLHKGSDDKNRYYFTQLADLDR
jgi:hypothetical protein